MPSNFPQGFDSLPVTPNPTVDDLEDVFAGRAHAAHHRDVGDAITAIQQSVVAKNHNHSGNTPDNPKLKQANTHENADTDTSANAIHHTLGKAQFQAASGTHIHAIRDSGWRTLDNLIQGPTPDYFDVSVSGTTAAKYFKSVTNATFSIVSGMFNAAVTSGTGVLRSTPMNLSSGHYELSFTHRTVSGTTNLVANWMDGQGLPSVLSTTTTQRYTETFYVSQAVMGSTVSFQAAASFRIGDITLRRIPAPTRKVSYTIPATAFTESTPYVYTFSYTNPLHTGNGFSAIVTNVPVTGARVLRMTESGSYSVRVPYFEFPALAGFQNSRAYVEIRVWRGGASSTNEIYRTSLGNYETIGQIDIPGLTLNSGDSISVGNYIGQGAFRTYTVPSFIIEIEKVGDAL